MVWWHVKTEEKAFCSREHHDIIIAQNWRIRQSYGVLVWQSSRSLAQLTWMVWWRVKTGPAGKISHTDYRLDCRRWQQQQEESGAKQRSGSEDWQSRAIRQWLPLIQVSRAVRLPLFTASNVVLSKPSQVSLLTPVGIFLESLVFLFVFIIKLFVSACKLSFRWFELTWMREPGLIQTISLLLRIYKSSRKLNGFLTPSMIISLIPPHEVQPNICHRWFPGSGWLIFYPLRVKA